MTLLSEPKQLWTVTISLLSEREVELYAALDTNPALHSETVRCAVNAGLEQLELLFACTPEAEFRLAVRAPDGSFASLTTRRWRFALYFISSQYERSFVSTTSKPSAGQAAGERVRAPEPSVRANAGMSELVQRETAPEPANDASAPSRKAHA
jgi:hypothetical protein